MFALVTFFIHMPRFPKMYTVSVLWRLYWWRYREGETLYFQGHSTQSRGQRRQCDWQVMTTIELTRQSTDSVDVCRSATTTTNLLLQLQLRRENKERHLNVTVSHNCTALDFVSRLHCTPVRNITLLPCAFLYHLNSLYFAHTAFKYNFKI